MNAKNSKIKKETPTTRRFQALFDSGLLTERDRSFLDSLLSSYLRSGSLTAGRRAALEKVEARIQNAALNGISVDTSTQTRLETLISGGGLDTWATSFVNSLLSQIKVGRILSSAQTAHLEKLENKLAASRVFASSFTDEQRALFSRAVEYYRSTSYFTNVVQDFDANPAFVPSQHVFEKMTNNPYFKKVVEAQDAAPKFAEGDLVGLSKAITNTYAGRGIMSEIASLLGMAGREALKTSALRGMVLVNDGLTVVSSVRGAKRYKVLFFGASTPILIEERFLVRGK